MPSDRAPGTPPPEVPEEFAQAYRDAYAAAMAAMSAQLPDATAGGTKRGLADVIPRQLAVALLGFAIIVVISFLTRVF